MYSPFARQSSFTGRSDRSSAPSSVTSSGRLKITQKLSDDNENVKNVQRRNAPPVAPLSPENIEIGIKRKSNNNDVEQSRLQVDPFYLHGSDEILRSDNTVTLFGFPQHCLMSIIDDFSTFGKIRKYQMDCDGGNWVHVQFENKFQANRAKEQHGKIFSGFMIGVAPCLETEMNLAAMDESEANNSQSLTDSMDSSRYGSIRNASVLSPIQNRTRVFNRPDGRNASTPTKSTGLLNYLFSW